MRTINLVALAGLLPVLVGCTNSSSIQSNQSFGGFEAETHKNCLDRKVTELAPLQASPLELGYMGAVGCSLERSNLADARSGYKNTIYANSFQQGFLETQFKLDIAYVAEQIGKRRVQ